MKLALDTSYFMYGFDISPKSSIPKNVLDIFVENNEISELIFSDLVIFELNAKASKKLPECIDLDNRTESLIKLEEETKFKKVSSQKNRIWELACFLKSFHKDFVDCIHWATAITQKADYFISEDDVLKNLTDDKNFRGKFQNKFDYNLPKIMNFSSWLKYTKN